MGFTLIEMLVGLAILSAALIASYSTVSGALKTASRLAERRVAVEAVQHEMNMLRRAPTIRVQSIEGETNAYQWRVSVEVVQGLPGKVALPFRIMGQLSSKSIHGHTETVVDTIVVAGGT